MAKFKFEEYRQPWETGPHWELKREFLEKYIDMFPEDRLLCLAQAYSNVVLMNCSYPDPVMRQINSLSKPLQMRKKFQGISNSDDAKSSESQQKREKIKSIYENSGRPFKQIKFCTSGEQTATSDIYENQSSATLNNSEVKRNILQESSEEKDILSSLGIEFINKFVERIRYFEMKCTTSVGMIAGAAQALKIQSRISFDISSLPNSSGAVSGFCSKFYIDNCLISKETASRKKEAREKSAQSAVNTLIKISRSSILENNDCSNPALSVVKKEQTNNIDKNVDENMKVLQIFSEKIANRSKEQSVASSLKHITEDPSLQKYISFDIIANNSQVCPYVCKFFINNVLISSGAHMTITHAKVSAIENGFSKLENLSKYEIQNDELVDQQNNSESKSSDLISFHSVKNHPVTETVKTESTPFILNTTLFNNSMRDSFVLLDNISLPVQTPNNVKSIVQASATFSRQTFEYQFEDVPENPSLKKANVVIEGEIIASGIAPAKETAKTLACENAIDVLKQKYYTLKVKNEYIEGYIIQRNQLYEGESFKSGILTESNIGCKMLKSMGWTGGALGSSGIVEPIEAQGHQTFGTTGLGYGSNNVDFKLFRRRIDSMLQDYKNTNTLSGLVFSKEFSKEERKIIHKMAIRYNLHSSSRGTDENRFLTVRHKYSVTELLQYLANNGGSSGKYELVDASETPFTL